MVFNRFVYCKINIFYCKIYLCAKKHKNRVNKIPKTQKIVTKQKKGRGFFIVIHFILCSLSTKINDSGLFFSCSNKCAIFLLFPLPSALSLRQADNVWVANTSVDSVDRWYTVLLFPGWRCASQLQQTSNQ